MMRWIKIAVGVLPCLATMYLLYWLEREEVWVPETPLRDMMTIGLVAAGMLTSYFLYSYLVKKR